MKKVLFTALFSFVIYICDAKNLEIEEIEVSKGDFPCTRMWVQDIENLMEDYCATYEQAVVIADRNFEACLDDMYGN